MRAYVGVDVILHEGGIKSSNRFQLVIRIQVISQLLFQQCSLVDIDLDDNINRLTNFFLGSSLHNCQLVE
jgi:hypothetical protein